MANVANQPTFTPVIFAILPLVSGNKVGVPIQTIARIRERGEQDTLVVMVDETSFQVTLTAAEVRKLIYDAQVEYMAMMLEATVATAQTLGLR